ncbi:DUF397 domain-containing protein [Streptomyces tsukubensis]|uniref:DUF397 domain-containing protein n=1 Tax=Streptomyces tsukubensis TaxID=83656 RepID=UPI003685AF79
MSTTPDLSHAIWHKSSYSGNGGANCVEWAPEFAPSGSVPVRDSKNPGGPTLIVSTAAWSGLVALVRGADL